MLSVFPQTTYITRDIIATDGGNRSTSVELAVTITNVKNQPPQWEKDSYSVVIPENTPRDTPIVVPPSFLSGFDSLQRMENGQINPISLEGSAFRLCQRVLTWFICSDI